MRPLAVNKIVGSLRVLNAHFARMVAHFAFEADFARVGTGHDKGAIEVRGKRSRLDHLVPIPEGETLEAINTALLAALDEQVAVRRNVVGQTVLERFAEEAALFVTLPEEPFEARVPVRAGVDRQSLVRLGGGTYSLPCHWARQEVMAWIGAFDIRFEWRAETEVVARTGPGGKQIRYLHYLPELAKKPKAVRPAAGRTLHGEADDRAGPDAAEAEGGTGGTAATPARSRPGGRSLAGLRGARTRPLLRGTGQQQDAPDV